VGLALVLALAKKGHQPRLLPLKYRLPGGSRVELAVKMRFHGAVTGKPNDNDFTIRPPVDKGRAQVGGIDDTDNCPFPPPDQRLLRELVRQLNKQLHTG
jgi:hypothetical protein